MLCFSCFYHDKSKEPGIMLVQCESANDSVELLDSVRHIIQRETDCFLEQINHTVLLLSVTRGRPLGGYQGKITPYSMTFIYNVFSNFLLNPHGLSSNPTAGHWALGSIPQMCSDMPSILGQLGADIVVFSWINFAAFICLLSTLNLITNFYIIMHVVCVNVFYCRTIWLKSTWLKKY